MSELPELSDRARHLLKTLVGRYIRDGEPVGSRTLARSSGLKLSPATIRNVMSDLEEFGFVAAPHTSAGRIPTTEGYRFFVDALLTVKPMDLDVKARLENDLTTPQTTQELVTRASSLLSAVTNFVGLVTVPKREQFAFRHIDFVLIEPRKVLVIIVFDDNEVQNRVIETRQDHTPMDLEHAANYLNQEFSGLFLQDIHDRILREMHQARESMESAMQATMDVAQGAFKTEPKDDMVLAGQTNLMSHHDFTDIGRLRELFEAFAQKRDILQLLDACIQAQGVRLFIGDETGSEALDACSLVTAPYSVDDKVVGVLGVIGPTRMRYDRIIPVVDATARILGSALNPKS